MRASVIIPTHNRPAVLARILTILTNEIERDGLAGEVEIVVADDASEPPARDALPANLRQLDSRILKVVRLPVNEGASAARNAGVENSSGAVLIFLDDDIVPADDYISSTLEEHRRYPEILILNANLRPLRDDIYSRFWFYYYALTFNRPGDLYEVAMLASGNSSIKRSVLSLENPLFDISLPTREDFDLYLRLKARGIAAWKSDRILAYNDCRSSLRGFITQRLHYADGQQHLLAKYDAELLNDENRRRGVPPNWRFAHLYLALAFAHTMAGFQRRLRQLWMTARPRVT